MSFITIRKPSMWTPSYYKLTNVFNPPHVTVNDVMNYYTIVHEFYIEDESCEMVVDSENSESNTSMQISSDENDKMSVDTNANDKMQEKLVKIYYQINSVVNGFTLNFGDIVEFPNGQMYFYHTPCIKIN
jgi:hypothetical protein